jgi:hypothetical protein
MRAYSMQCSAGGCFEPSRLFLLKTNLGASLIPLNVRAVEMHMVCDMHSTVDAESRLRVAPCEAFASTTDLLDGVVDVAAALNKCR